MLTLRNSNIWIHNFLLKNFSTSPHLALIKLNGGLACNNSSNKKRYERSYGRSICSFYCRNYAIRDYYKVFTSTWSNNLSVVHITSVKCSPGQDFLPAIWMQLLILPQYSTDNNQIYDCFYSLKQSGLSSIFNFPSIKRRDGKKDSEENISLNISVKGLRCLNPTET